MPSKPCVCLADQISQKITKIHTNECKQGAGCVKRALKLLAMHKKYFNRAPSQLLHFKNDHGPGHSKAEETFWRKKAGENKILVI